MWSMKMKNSASPRKKSSRRSRSREAAAGRSAMDPKMLASPARAKASSLQQSDHVAGEDQEPDQRDDHQRDPVVLARAPGPSILDDGEGQDGPEDAEPDQRLAEVHGAASAAAGRARRRGGAGGR